jgi:hypothetical protein
MATRGNSTRGNSWICQGSALMGPSKAAGVTSKAARIIAGGIIVAGAGLRTQIVSRPSGPTTRNTIGWI